MAAWDGRGRPPSEAAAYDWMVDNGIDQATARAVVDANTLTELGDAAREIVELKEERDAPFANENAPDRTGTLGPAGDALKRGAGMFLTPLNPMQAPIAAAVQIGRGLMGNDGSSGGGSSTPRTAEEAIAAVKAARDQANALIAQLQGKTPEEVEAILNVQGGGDALAAMIASGPAFGPQRGAPLLPPSIAAMGDQFQTEEQTKNWAEKASFFGSSAAGMYDRTTGPRYFEEDLLEPWKWSREDRAAIQRVMAKIGLYAAAGEGVRPRLGSWGEIDSQVFAELLTTANVEGRTWRDQLRQWSANPPADLQRILRQQRRARAEAREARNQKPTYQVTDPATIQAEARATSLDLIGRVPTQPVLDPATYQTQEIAAQQAVTRDQRAGGGGTVVAAPSPGIAAEQQIREKMPLEVDAYSFMNAFQGFLSMLGGPQ